MTDKDTARQTIMQLVEKFSANHKQYTAPQYNETELRIHFVNPFFEALGWDMADRGGRHEVFHEDYVEVEEEGRRRSKRPDYGFRTGSQTRFFVETKKPSVNLKTNPDPAFQARRYGWSARLPVSILTDFEEFIIYDCRLQPDRDDPPQKGRLAYYDYTQYVEKWDEIYDLLSYASVQENRLESWIQASKPRGTITVDDAFLQEMEDWREQLAKDIALHNDGLTPRQLNMAVQTTIDRIVFLRICEDRGIEPYGRLEGYAKSGQLYASLMGLFKQADARYNSGLFHFSEEQGRENPDTLTPKLTIGDSVLKRMIKRLYYPGPYAFAVIPADILGQIYERFLGKVIEMTASGRARVVEKPEVRKAGGVYYTPTYIVDYIVKNTVGKLVEGKTPKEVEKLRILDPACGSGSFLIGAFQFLLDWHLNWYVNNDAAKHVKAKRLRVIPTQSVGAQGERSVQQNLNAQSVGAQHVAPLPTPTPDVGTRHASSAQPAPTPSQPPPNTGEESGGATPTPSPYSGRAGVGSDPAQSVGAQHVAPLPTPAPDVGTRHASSAQPAPTPSQPPPNTGEESGGATPTPSPLAGRVGEGVDSGRAGVGLTETTHALTTAEKKRILLNNLYGVDLDQQAVEVTKLSLLLKVLEGETAASAQPELMAERVLPDLDDNIKWGNSLIGPDYYAGKQMTLFDDESIHRVQAFDWHSPGQGFGQIMAAGGFDTVIGNPPYGASITDEQSNYYRNIYATAVAHLDTFALFMEKALTLLRISGLFGMIIPSGWVSAPKTRQLRQVFITQFRPQAFASMPYDVFKNAYIDTVIVTGEKLPIGKTLFDFQEAYVDLVPFPPRFQIQSIKDFSSHLKTADARKWLNDSNLQFLVTASDRERTLVAKLQASGRFSDVADIQRGVTPFNLTLEQPRKNPKRAFNGTVRRYSISEDGVHFIRYDESLAEYKPPRYFTGPRLLLRELISRQFQLQAVYADEDFVTNKSMQSVLLTDTRYSLQFLLGLLNSRIMSWYFLAVSSVGRRDDFPKIVLKQTRELPLRTINFDDSTDKARHDKIVMLVEQMLSLHRQRASASEAAGHVLQALIDKTDRDIDALVYELYGLTEAEIALVEGR